MVEKGYFAEGEAREPRAKMIPEPDDDEAVVYEDFFLSPVYACLRILLWATFYYTSRHSCTS
jgi:hypothetical protein